MNVTAKKEELNFFLDVVQFLWRGEVLFEIEYLDLIEILLY